MYVKVIARHSSHIFETRVYIGLQCIYTVVSSEGHLTRLVNDTCKCYCRYRYGYFLLKLLAIPIPIFCQKYRQYFCRYFYRYFLFL